MIISEETIKDVSEYIRSRKGYYGDDVQVIDLLKSTGDLNSFCIGNVIKYVSRYGKKPWQSDYVCEQDLLKAIHYIVLLMENAPKDPTPF